MRNLLTLTLALLATTASADIKFAYEAGVSLYAQFDDASDTCVTLTEGTSLKAGSYTAADSAIATASLPAGTYMARIRIGTAGTPSASDPHVGTLERFVWDGTNETDQLTEVLTDTAAMPTAAANADAVWDEQVGDHAVPGSTGTNLSNVQTNVTAVLEDTGTTLPASIAAVETAGTCTAEDVYERYTFKFPRSGSSTTASNRITLYNGFAGDIAFDVSGLIHNETTLNSVSSVTVSDTGATVGTVRLHTSKTKFLVPLTDVDTAGTYTVTATFVTADSQTIVCVGTLVVQ